MNEARDFHRSTNSVYGLQAGANRISVDYDIRFENKSKSTNQKYLSVQHSPTNKSTLLTGSIKDKDFRGNTSQRMTRE